MCVQDLVFHHQARLNNVYNTLINSIVSPTTLYSPKLPSFKSATPFLLAFSLTLPYTINKKFSVEKCISVD